MEADNEVDAARDSFGAGLNADAQQRMHATRRLAADICVIVFQTVEVNAMKRCYYDLRNIVEGKKLFASVSKTIFAGVSPNSLRVPTYATYILQRGEVEER